MSTRSGGRKRADGEASSERILDAAAALAGERGFQGTTIRAVSERSGLPPSSIYWHFADKDELIAAVIDRSYSQWVAALDGAAGPVPFTEDGDGDPGAQSLESVLGATGATLGEFGDFLRLGLLLILDHSPDQPTARAKFLDVRRSTAERVRALYTHLFTDIDEAGILQLVTLTLVLSDGVFIARDADGLSPTDGVQVMVDALLGTAARLRSL